MNKKTIGISVVVLTVFLGVGIWWLFNSGRLVYVAPGTQAPAGVVVCGTDTVNKYNEAAYFIRRKGADKPSVDQESLNTLVAEIKNKKEYETDPTCQTILFWTAVYSDDYTAASDASKAVKELHAKRMFADTNIRSNDAVFNYKTHLNGLTGAEIQEEVSGE